jgi:hypothetical protein
MTMSLDAAARSGDSGIAWDAVIAAKLRPNATAAAASSFMGNSFLNSVPQSGGLRTNFEIMAERECQIARQVSPRRGERPLNCATGPSRYQKFHVFQMVN